MTATTEKVLAAAMTLTPSEREDLIEALVEAGEPEEPRQLSEAWLAELRRRHAEIEAGGVVFTPWDVVRERVRARLGMTDGG